MREPLGRNDIYGVIGGAPNVRFVEGTIHRISASEIFVTSPVFDAGLEFGPVTYFGPTPTLGASCVVGIMTGTTEAFLMSWDGPNAGIATGTWIAFPFASGFSNYAGGYQACEYMLDPFGWVHLRGLFKFTPTGSYSTWIPGTLPVGYRPAGSEIFSTTHSSGVNFTERVDVETTGIVRGSTTASGNWDGAYGSLAGIHFRVAAAPATIPSGPAGPQGPQGPAGNTATVPLDSWHNVNAAGEPGYQNSWVAFGAPFPGARFRVDINGKVTVGGLLAKGGGNWVANETIFTLPVGYRPDAQLVFYPRMLGGATENNGRIDLFADGSVKVVAGGLANPVGWCDLEGIEFYVAAPPTSVLTGPQGATGAQGPAGAGVTPLTPTAKSATYTAAYGDLVLTTNSFTVTLPAHAAGGVVGVKVTDARTGAAPVTISAPSGLIIGPGIGVASAGAASMVLGIMGAFVILESDGTNWHVISGQQDSGHIAWPFITGLGNLAGHVCSYRKKGEMVTARGEFTYVSGTAPWGLGTLPAGFRPLNSAHYPTMGTGAGGGYAPFLIHVEPSGIASMEQGGSGLPSWTGGHASLWPISFEAVG